MSGPYWSIITLTQDRPDYLAQAIESVEKQTEWDWEHLVFANGSTDPRVFEVLKAAKERNPDSFFYAAPGREGPKYSVGYYWNALIGMARGKWITMLDDDNLKAPDFLEKMSAPMKADPSVDAVTCGWNRINAVGTHLGERHCNLQASVWTLARNNLLDCNSLLFRRDALDRIGWFDATLTTNEDWHFVIRLMRACKVRHLPDALVHYREHAGQLSHKILELGALENWKRIRRELFTAEELQQAAASNIEIPIAGGEM